MMRWVCTSNRGFANLAMEELRRLFPGVSFQQLAAGEVFAADIPLERDEMLAAIAEKEPIFLRHIQPVDRALPVAGNADDLSVLSDTIRYVGYAFDEKRTAVHVRRAEATRFPYSVSDTKAVLDAVLTEIGGEPAMQEPEVILTVYAAAEELLVGWGSPQELLSDWPGGAVRFQREEGQISRAKFKLLEAERTFGLRLSDFREALDVGAAPGGWTSLLLERGLAVTAVDPAELHPSLKGYPKLTYLNKNAGDVRFGRGSFDLLVCDMSWSPMLMVKLVMELRQALKPGATAIITVKLMHRKPLQTIRDVVDKLEGAFELRKAKQLFHNRDEITLYLTKRT
ncbi:SAM-dependent methyltransferase [Paenibacillus darwinianus]|uniref:SAM-dependent methyltransferase n=1 Tax=Paenibacillus darwinianus TaxID=1380763 RepID=A0A9W5S2H0_9BACL|nr:SAM-dependent methyltransferase [Paenibacillus darwinianus]EXX89895.1 SAM-dependent methyltransferase [Paenibacillus darwinianus]EXX90343.1 SAM-dependent methyltransferase [Paenibacillus darwinianus]EXX90733.1 SAM-dependent methyltransferase [Paenibacillus darwinianus]